MDQRQEDFLSEITRDMSGLDEADKRIRLLVDLGIALSAERNMDLLLEKILTGARRLTGADAGSIYIVNRKENEEDSLTFAQAQCDSLDIPFSSSEMPLKKSSLAGYVAMTGQSLNLENAYEIPDDVPYGFDPSFDRATGYQTRSVLVVPMADHKGRITGVVQLINRKRDWGYELLSEKDFRALVTPFDKEGLDLARALASQAAVAWENARLLDAMERLFEGLVNASVQAIEARDPTTSGHSLRVTQIALFLARAWNEQRDNDPEKGAFTEDELRELRYAGLLHDFGKIGVPERVLRKALRLSDTQLELIQVRFMLLRKITSETGDDDLLDRLDRGWKALGEMNVKGWISDGEARLVEELLRTSVQVGDEEIHALTEEEGGHLLVRKGNLTPEERSQMDAHVLHTYDFLKKIPWPEELKRIPSFAAGHHEKLDGSGYPWGLSGEELSIQQQLLAVADIAEALTAKDRPYRKPIPPDVVIRILREEAEAGKLHAGLVELFANLALPALEGSSPES